MNKAFDLENLYIEDYQDLIGNVFEIALIDYEFDPGFFSFVFSKSKTCREMENGNPFYIAGKSPEEIISLVLKENGMREETIFAPRNVRKEQEYWAGWVLAYYQMKSKCRYRDIFAKLPLLSLLNMYPKYHEMDIERSIEEIDRRMDLSNKETNLKRFREMMRLSQSELARISGVKVRMIQLYEQRENDIDKAQVKTLYRLSKALKCHIEDLLENPMKE